MKWWRGGTTRRHGKVTYHAISPLMPLYSGGRRSIRQAVVFAICCLRLIAQPLDVIEADHMPYMQLVPLKLVALVRRKRLVVTWHECWGPQYWRNYLGAPGRMGWLCESVAMRLPDTIIAASGHTAERLREFTGSKVPVVVAPNGIDREVICDVEAGPTGADVVVVGRLLRHKRIDLLLAALRILEQSGRPASACIVGTGPQLESLQCEAQALGIAHRVHFRRDVETQRGVYGLLKGARVAVFPSEREGFGIAVLEALACGVPVITTSAPDNLAQHLVARCANGGTVCEPTAAALADAIAAVLARPDRAAEDRAWLAEYDWEAITDSVAAVLT